MKGPCKLGGGEGEYPHLEKKPTVNKKLNHLRFMSLNELDHTKALNSLRRTAD